MLTEPHPQIEFNNRLRQRHPHLASAILSFAKPMIVILADQLRFREPLIAVCDAPAGSTRKGEPVGVLTLIDELEQLMLPILPQAKATMVNSF